MKLVVDMNLSPRWVGLLTTAGFEAVHWSEVGAATASDEQIMAWGIGADAVVLTWQINGARIDIFPQKRIRFWPLYSRALLRSA
jgi:hypothetical protein